MKSSVSILQRNIKGNKCKVKWIPLPTNTLPMDISFSFQVYSLLLIVLQLVYIFDSKNASYFKMY